VVLVLRVPNRRNQSVADNAFPSGPTSWPLRGQASGDGL